MQNWQKLMHYEHENGLKPHFGPFLALIGPISEQNIQSKKTFFMRYSEICLVAVPYMRALLTKK